jgi:hypothetical protein
MDANQARQKARTISRSTEIDRLEMAIKACRDAINSACNLGLSTTTVTLQGMYELQNFGLTEDAARIIELFKQQGYVVRLDLADSFRKTSTGAGIIQITWK